MTSIDVRCLPEPFKSRITTYQHTLDVCRLVHDSQLLTYKYSFDANWHPLARYDSTPVSVIESDTFVAASRLSGKIACLNFADDSFPTGCASTGSGAQEESLCYRSTLSKHIDMKHYPLINSVLLYSPGVIVFKAPEEENFQAIKPFKVDVISCPGIRHPCLDTLSGNMTAADMQILRIKVETILQVAYNEHVDNLVLGALGCGAWRNPPGNVASTFKYAIEKYPGLFQSIVFAIKPSQTSHTSSTDSCNFGIFHSCLDNINV